MATRSTIALEFADGTIGQVYCHWDGYLDNNGKLLQAHYMDPFKVRDLIDLGSISSLRPEIGVAHPFSVWDLPEGQKMDREEFDTKFGNMTTFHGRDRGEDISVHKFSNFEEYVKEHQYEEYEYILRTDGKWYVSFCKSEGEYIPLEEAFWIEVTV
jgi:hypothetical protein